MKNQYNHIVPMRDTTQKHDNRPLCYVLAHDAYWANWREGTVC